MFIESGVEQAAWVGNYTQTWFVGTVQISPDINFSVRLATVVPFNVTHPELSPSFLAGDSYQYTVYGPPNQPVYTSQNSGPSNLVGRTDGSGYFRETGVEQTAWIGNYTQVWSVGNIQVSPALTFFVGQLQPGGTLTSTDIGQTSNGSVTGTSIVSVSNGTVSTYSATQLGYTASLYYDAQTVGTLYQERTAIAQGVTPISGGGAAGYLSAPAINWNDYDLQTDHYVVAFFLSGSSYQNPLYFSEGGCDDANSDCTIGGGSGAYWIQAASIYLGSTLADQTNIPQDGSVPTFPDALYDNFLASSQQPRPSGLTFKIDILAWAQKLHDIEDIAAAADKADLRAHPIPVMLDHVPGGDDYVTNAGTGGQARQRAYVLKDNFGNLWSNTAAVVVRERFAGPVGPGVLPAADGCWFTLSGCTNKNGLIDVRARVYDSYGLGMNSAEIGYIQYYFAFGFVPPSKLANSGFTLPSVSRYGLVVPLWIHDADNLCKSANADMIPGQPVRLTHQYAGINGDSGPGKGCAPPVQ